MPVLQIERDQSILRLTLNDPSTRNSVSEAMLAELSAAIENAAKDSGVAVITIAATGPAFSSGHNLKELTVHRADNDAGLSYFNAIFQRCAKLMTAIAEHRCTIIAEVDGLASAAGCQLVASCDLAYASPRAGFCTPGVNIGLFCSTPMVPLSRSVANKHAMEMLLTGDTIDATDAARIGLINRVIPQNELRTYVTSTATKIASKSQAAIRFGKRAFYDQKALPLEQAYAHAATIMTQNMLHGAACEGLNAFIEKRKPDWPS